MVPPPRALALKSPAGSHPTGYTTRCGQPSRSPLEGSGGRKRLLRVWRERCGQGLEGGGAEPRPRTGGACSESPGERELPPLPGSGETQWEHVTTPEHLANGAGRGGGRRSQGIRGPRSPGCKAGSETVSSRTLHSQDGFRHHTHHVFSDDRHNRPPVTNTMRTESTGGAQGAPARGGAAARRPRQTACSAVPGRLPLTALSGAETAAGLRPV